MRDESHNPIHRPDGRPRHEPCVDPATREHAEMLFRAFTQDRVTAYKLAKKFNELKVENWTGFTVKGIKDTLANTAYIGVFIYNRTRGQYDHETQKWVRIENPRSEWIYVYDANLSFISHDLWFAAQKRLAQMRANSPLTGRKFSRNQISASTLFSGTLFCGYCGQELKLYRSTKEAKSRFCPQGSFALHGCKLSTCKSTRMIEEAVLGFIREVLLTEAAIESVVARANDFLANERRKPRINTTSLKAEARKLEAKIVKLVLMVEDQPDPDLCRGGTCQ